jgi:hypothetical protein
VAWGKALDAMSTSPGASSPDPKALNDKQRQIVKDKFSAVNAAVGPALS